MAWVVPLATTAVGLWAGNEQAKAAEEAEKVDREMNAIETQYSWATPANIRDVRHAGSRAGQQLAGAASGLQLGMGLQQGMGKTTPKTPQGGKSFSSLQDAGIQKYGGMNTHGQLEAKQDYRMGQWMNA